MYQNRYFESRNTTYCKLTLILHYIKLTLSSHCTSSNLPGAQNLNTKTQIRWPNEDPNSNPPKSNHNSPLNPSPKHQIKINKSNLSATVPHPSLLPPLRH
ncbi:hypothetical protein V6Z11_D07G079700 [Gossypium hirsutum]